MGEEAPILGEDPMGLMAEELMAEDGDLLANLYGGKFAGEDEEEGDADEGDEDDADEGDEDDADEGDDEKASSKKASRLRPQPRKASKGVKSVGAVNKTAASEISELANLWESAPDVSNVFGS